MKSRSTPRRALPSVSAPLKSTLEMAPFGQLRWAGLARQHDEIDRIVDEQRRQSAPNASCRTREN
jgi:hypothetical protein